MSEMDLILFCYKYNTNSNIVKLQDNQGGGGGLVAQSVERTTPGEEVLGSIPAVAASSLLVGSVSV